MDFLGFAKIFLWASCKIRKAVKIQDTSYLLRGTSPKLASGSVRLVGIKTRPTAVGPPLLLTLQLHQIHVVESFASVTLPCLGCLDVLVQHILNVVTLHPQLA
jgi:hypothetical protein